MLVRDLAQPNVLAALASDRLTDAAKVMLREGVGSLVVFSDGEAVGILTERDLVRAVAEDGPRVAEVGDYMSRDTAFAMAEEDCLAAAERMLSMGVRHLPVLEGGKVVGMVSARDLLALEAWPPLKKRPTASKSS